MRTKIRTKPIKLRYQFIIFFVLIILSCLDIKSGRGAEYELFVGLGIHNEQFDCPGSCYNGDTLFIMQFTIKAEGLPLAAQAIHISNPNTTSDGYGTNAVVGGLYFSW